MASIPLFVIGTGSMASITAMMTPCEWLDQALLAHLHTDGWGNMMRPIRKEPTQWTMRSATDWMTVALPRFGLHNALTVRAGTTRVGTTAAVVALLTLSVCAAAGDSSLDADVEQNLERTERPANREGSLRAHWKHGPRFTSEGGDFEVDINARMFFDLVWRGSNDFPAPDTPNDAGLQSVRLGVHGHAYRNAIYKLQLDFAGAEIALKDVYVGLRELGPEIRVIAGHFKEPFGLEELTSSASILFRERSQATTAFAPSRNFGLMVSTSPGTHFPERLIRSKFDTPGIVTLSVGVFRSTDSQGNTTSDDASITARLAALVVRRPKIHSGVHVALSYSYRGDDTVSYSDGAGFVDTGTMTVSGSQRLGAEFAWVWNAFTLAAEYFYTAEDQIGLPNTNFHGGYAKIGYWLTGEGQGWHTDRFVATRPRQNFFDGTGGMGALWIGYRFDLLDLNDGAIRGGREFLHTFGVIWRWNPTTRILLNYVFDDVRSGPKGAGEVQSLSIRFQFNF
jgi:phosphate-selective porin OprO/OprP